MTLASHLPTTRDELASALRDARSRLLAMVADLDEEQLRVPLLEIVNPFLWEIGHVAWFHERWLLRHRAGREALRPGVDARYDSAGVAHDTRWILELPSREQTLAYMSDVQDAVFERLERVDLDRDELYFHRLALFHEDMHVEAFAYMRQTLGYAEPDLGLQPAAPQGGAGALSGEVELPGGVISLGAPPDAPFAFDNEQWAHDVEVAPFRLSRAQVTQAEFREFVADGGYARQELWSPAGWSWRLAADARHPVYWRRSGDTWERRHFDRWQRLEAHLPVHHVCYHEADAFCRWAGRRLPSEAEWELAAGPARHPWGDADMTADTTNADLLRTEVVDVGAFPASDTASGLRQLVGNTWEWTSTPFGPYPGFRPGPYREYSAPWFGDHRVLRGGAFATRGRLLRNTWRNYYKPYRRDVLSGFRTAADG